VGVEGGVRNLRDVYGIETDVVAGPATDNRVGGRFVASLGLPALNARTQGRELGALVLDKVRASLPVRA
jgi:hypothetical protein